MVDPKVKSFYDREYLANAYSKARQAEEHSNYSDLKEFIEKYGLFDKRCLEVGAGRGAFQDLVADYTGTDLSDTVQKCFHKPFVQTSATTLPFPNNSFDAIWSIAVLEHVSRPEDALSEMRRVLKDGGLLYLAPAWQCRSWAAEGYPVRPYSDLGVKGKLIKASIPVRNSIVYRACSIFPQRLLHRAKYLITKCPTTFVYGQLNPNYQQFWMPDSDAVNAMDPHEAILWFVSRGDLCLSQPTLVSQFFVRTGKIVIKIKKTPLRSRDDLRA